MSFLNKFYKQESVEKYNPSGVLQANETMDASIFNQNELLEITTDLVLDTSSSLAIRKFQHNLKILTKRAKEEGKVDQFMIIRDDDFFPDGWQWIVSSKDTALEKVSISLSSELKMYYALKNANLLKQSHGIQIPVSQEKTIEALSRIDKDLASLYVPVHFRSTKHFTINTPLEITGDYNSVESHRNFTILDNMDAFLSSGYGYSVSYHDVYLDIAHEPLPISKNAIVLIEESKYQEIQKNPDILEQLKSRKVIIYKGEEFVAINMILSQQGILPSQVGDCYFHYDQEINDILKTSIQSLAKENHLLYDQSHGGKNGHFTDFYDQKNTDFQDSIENLVQFLNSKFPEHTQLITAHNVQNSIYSNQIIEAIGADNLLCAIEEYNSIFFQQFLKNYEYYQSNRLEITPDIHEIFQKTVHRIQMYYVQNESSNYTLENQVQLEEDIRHFYQDSTVQEQLLHAKSIWSRLTQEKETEVIYDDEVQRKK